VDRLLRGINLDLTVRLVAAIATETVRDACARHELRGPEAVALGRGIVAGCLLATLTKHEDERVRIAVEGNGVIGRLLVDALANGDVRGCLERRSDTAAPAARAPHGPRISLREWIGDHGRVVVTRDLGLENQYQGVVAIEEGELDRDLERYLEHSEQLPSALACEVVLDARGAVLRAGGVLCQSFPAAPPDVLDPVRERLRGDELAQLMSSERSPDDLMGFALGGEAFDAMDSSPLRFRCNCGPERAHAVLSTLGADDLEELAREPGDTEVRCSYCGSSYHVDAEALLRLAQRLRDERS